MKSRKEIDIILSQREEIVEKLRQEFQEYQKINTNMANKQDIVARLDFVMSNIALLLKF